MSLTTAFHENFGEGERCDLDTTYRFNSRIGEVANRFIQQNPGQLKKPLNSLTNGDKKESDAVLSPVHKSRRSSIDTKGVSRRCGIQDDW